MKNRVVFEGTRSARSLFLLLIGTGAAEIASAGPPTPFRHPDLDLLPREVRGSDLPAAIAARLAKLRAPRELAQYDIRGGRWSTLVLSEPLLPGSGIGNRLTWERTAPAATDLGRWQAAAWSAMTAYVARFPSEIGVDVSELDPPRVGVSDGGDLIQIYAARRVRGIPVRDGGLTAVINHGNLVLLGLQNWGDASGAPPAISREDARAGFEKALGGSGVGLDGEPRLERIPVAPPGNDRAYDYRPVWVFRGRVGAEPETWEGLIDARSGEVLSLEDANAYITRRVMGGIYPFSNDGRGAEGMLQDELPMPFVQVTLDDLSTAYANSHGVLGCIPNGLTTSLEGLFVRIVDGCGAVDETVAAGSSSLDLEETSGTDCVVPSGHSAGDTNAARTSFYIVNRLVEQAKAYLPSNPWLQSPVTVNTNLNTQTCNAFWNGSLLQFFRDSGSDCRNGGEIAGVIAHEWAHGLDDNGVNGNLSNPSEGDSFIQTALRYNDPCIARGFFKNQVCSGFGDACVGTTADGCTGVADVDFANHTCGLPHTVDWIQNGFTAGQCGGVAHPGCGSGLGPCAREPHCEGQIVGETGWDLATRDLRSGPFNYDANTALELTTRLFYLASQTVTSWYSCAAGGSAAGTNGCGATNGYLQTLAADDDDGTLANGTPHITAIRNAFARHQIQCATPAVSNSGCAGGPATAPTLAATPLDQGAALSWNAVAGAARYAVFRTEGVTGCAFGKVKIAETAATAFTDWGLANGLSYDYAVLPIGANSVCFGRMSTCASVVPVVGADPQIVDPIGFAILTGDADASLDNCEQAQVTVEIQNLGSGALTNVRIVGATVPSHPTSRILTTFPVSVAPSLAVCDSAGAQVRFVPQGMAFDQTLEIEVALTADELDGETRNRTIAFDHVERDGTEPDVQTDTCPAAEPTALEADTLGNGVLEPGELAVIAPSWRNVGTGSLALAGEASGFTGPAGPTYAIADDTADYGTIGAAATKSCSASSNCFALQISAGARPLTHWDATFQETVAPLGTGKTWTLHVGDSFSDVPRTQLFYRKIEAIFHDGITVGCTPTTYCPSQKVPRSEMAIFIARGIADGEALPTSGTALGNPYNCTGGGTSAFVDVLPTDIFCNAVHYIAAQNVTGGCDATHFCPTPNVTRGEMAIFMAKAIVAPGGGAAVPTTYGPDPVTGFVYSCNPASASLHFTDVAATDAFCRHVHYLWARGAISGCAATEYCPAGQVGRDEMAKFLSNAFGFVLYGP